VKNLRALERVRERFEVMSLDRLDLRKLFEKRFVHHVVGDVHELSNTNCHNNPFQLISTAVFMR
jgi:hypothetical protein